MMKQLQLIRLSLIMILTSVLCGCGAVTTATGQLGPIVRFRHLLPEEILVKSPSYDEADDHEVVVRVGKTKAQLVIYWKTFEVEGKRYILSTVFEVIKSIAGLEIHADTGEPKDVYLEDSVTQGVPIFVSWIRRSGISGIERGSQGGVIRADGVWDPE